jgi:hypothetical protein
MTYMSQVPKTAIFMLTISFSGSRLIVLGFEVHSSTLQLFLLSFNMGGIGFFYFSAGSVNKERAFKNLSFGSARVS